jgi:transposase
MIKPNKNTTDKKRSVTQAPVLPEVAETKAKTIKLGVDVHLRQFVVTRIIDGGSPQPAQRFKPEEFLLWCAKQLQQAEEVYTCYEAGPFGYTLHRKLETMGITNYVVRPRDWDEYGQKVKTDKRDAAALADCLDRYVSGNHGALCVVRVPSQAEEQKRSLSRQREGLQKEKQRLAALESELTARTREVEAAAPAALPVGLGKLTSQILDREVADWNRFQNRRQVSSYTGLCPREDTSSDRRFQGSINKHGNRRLRPALIECAWRLLEFQPGYRAVKKWQAVLDDAKAGRPRRKKAIVALARTFAVDWWRLRTGRCQAEDLGLKLHPAPGPENGPDQPLAG